MIIQLALNFLFFPDFVPHASGKVQKLSGSVKVHFDIFQAEK